MQTTIDMPIALTGGVIYLLMALTLARMLLATPQARVVRLWVAGALGCGVSLLLVANRGWLPTFMGFELVGLVGSAAAGLQTAALRVLLGRPALQRGTLQVAAVLMLLGAVMDFSDDRRWVFVIKTLMLVVFNAQLTWHARLVAQRERSGSAAMMAWMTDLRGVDLEPSLLRRAPPSARAWAWPSCARWRRCTAGGST